MMEASFMISLVYYFNFHICFYIDKIYIQFILYTTYTLFDEEEYKREYLLLKCIRSYLAFDIYTGLVVYTSKTLEAGRNKLKTFHKLSEVFDLSKILKAN